MLENLRARHVLATFGTLNGAEAPPALLQTKLLSCSIENGRTGLRIGFGLPEFSTAQVSMPLHLAVYAEAYLRKQLLEIKTKRKIRTWCLNPNYTIENTSKNASLTRELFG